MLLYYTTKWGFFQVNSAFYTDIIHVIIGLVIEMDSYNLDRFVKMHELYFETV